MRIFLNHIYFLAAAMFLYTNGNAQIEVLFETDQPYTMLIGFDGFTQTPKAVSKAVIAQIAPGEHTLQLIALGKDTVVFKKTINLYEKEKQHYMLTRDYEGIVQLQYRGIIERFPLEAPIINQQKLVPWKGINSKKLVKPVVAKIEKPDAKIPAKKDTSLSTTVKPQTTAVAAAANIIAKKDSLNQLLIKPKTAPANASIGGVIETVSNTTSEFEKLSILQKYAETHTLNISELTDLAKLLRFDDSRLQFLLKAKPLATTEEKIALGKVFQFEYTQKAFINAMP